MKKSQNSKISVAEGTTYKSGWEAQLIWDIIDADTILQLGKSVESPELISEVKHGVNVTWRISLVPDGKLKLSLDLLRTPSGFFESEFDFTLGGQTSYSEKSGLYVGKCEYESRKCGWQFNVTSAEKSFTTAQPVSKILKELKLFSERTLHVTVNIRTNLSLVGSTNIFPTLSGSKSISKNWVAELYSQSLYSDVAIKCQAQVFHCHKIILRQSSVFEKMITSPMLESLTNVINILDVNPASMEMFIKSLYGIDITVPTDSEALLELINCAEKYDMESLKITCLEAMARLLSDENAGELTLAAFKYCQDENFRRFFCKLLSAPT